MAYLLEMSVSAIVSAELPLRTTSSPEGNRISMRSSPAIGSMGSLTRTGIKSKPGLVVDNTVRVFLCFILAKIPCLEVSLSNKGFRNFCGFMAKSFLPENRIVFCSCQYAQGRRVTTCYPRLDNLRNPLQEKLDQILTVVLAIQACLLITLVG